MNERQHADNGPILFGLHIVGSVPERGFNHPSPGRAVEEGTLGRGLDKRIPRGFCGRLKQLADNRHNLGVSNMSVD